MNTVKAESGALDGEKGAKEKSALMAIKLSIERMLINDLDLDRQPWYKKLIQILACLNQKYISKELLISCAETVLALDFKTDFDPKLVWKQFSNIYLSHRDKVELKSLFL